MKKILGLDIGTNSIGWAFIESNAYEENPQNLDGRIIQLGSRIIPMDADSMNKFETGNPVSKAAGRRETRSARRLNQRYKLRRSRLIEALKILNWIPHEFPFNFKKLEKHSINDFLPISDEIRKEAFDFFGIEGKKSTKGLDYKVSEDWLIYFLKTRALYKQINLVELARILYHYNQRRGFKSSRKDAKIEEDAKTLKYPLFEKWVEIVNVTSITEIGKGEGKDKDYKFYELNCKTPRIEFKAIKKRKNPLDWINKDIEVEITKKTTKDLIESFTISEVDPSAWESRKKALEKDIEKENLNISEYYLKNLKNALKRNEPYTIKQRIVDRSFYQNEFRKIWEVQSRFYNSEFNDKTKIYEIADSFYTHNKQKNNELKGKDLFNILFNDIIYYQRGLKSQKSQLANCQYEIKNYKTKDGEIKKCGVKVTSRSSPCFQEFRIWQTIHNLKVFKKEDFVNGKTKSNIDVSAQYLTNENKEALFELFDNLNEVSHEGILKLLGFKKDIEENGEKTFAYKLNYFDEQNFIGNETKALFRKIFKKHDFQEAGEVYLKNSTSFNHLWHIVYSLPSTEEITSALSNKKYFDLPDEIINNISKLPEFKRQYASLSSKAINKLLPLMRIGKYWQNDFDQNTSDRIEKILNAEFDEKIPDKVREEIQKLDLRIRSDFNGLPTYLATYIVYGRHSERSNEEKYASIEDFNIKKIIPYNSLRNPVVEKIIREALSLTKDIWKNEKLGRPDFIHVELGREMKNNVNDRQKISESNFKNKIEKERIANLIKELKYPNFNENSISDVEKFRLWKEAGGNIGEQIFDDLFKKNNAEFVKDADIEKYRHWAEQNYRSPYTGRFIKLSELFTEKYQIDHIIPRAKFYDDSFANKVVVEAEINALKDKRLAMQFIEDSQHKDISLSNGETITVFSLEDYKTFSEQVFKSKKKKRHLKLYEIPEDFVERQMNDTKYISRTVAQFLRPIAIGNQTDEGMIYTSGSITSDLKQKWGLNKLWKELLKPRFERLEKILDEKLIFPSEASKDDYYFAKDYKRVDHRHHALDALVVACTTRSHIKYLNSLSSFSNEKKDIIKYNEWSKWKYLLNKKKQLENQQNGITEFGIPWENFYQESKQALEAIIVSHKPTTKLISKTINKYYKWTEVEPDKWEKKLHFQKQPLDEDKYWVAVRQSLFGQPLGKIFLAEYKKGLSINLALKAQIEFLKREKQIWNTEDWRIAKSTLRKQVDEIIKNFNFDEKQVLKYLNQNPLIEKDGVEISKLDLLQFKKYASKKVSIDESFTKDKIEKLPYANLPNNWLTNLLREHLKEYGDPKLAFKSEGLEMLFRKAPFPINKVTRKEGGSKIEKNNKLLDGDAGVNQYFLVEIKKEIDRKTGLEIRKRSYSTPNFLECIERLAKGLKIHDENPTSEYIVLSPGDIVYVPEKDEIISLIDWTNKRKISERTYIMKSSSETKCYFLPINISSLLHQYDAKTKKGEFESVNKSEKTKEVENPILIKENFIKLNLDRLGNIKPN